MLRFIKHNLTEIIGVEMYPVVSLIIFVGFFTFMLFRVWRMKKEDIDHLGSFPLEESDKNIKF